MIKYYITYYDYHYCLVHDVIKYANSTSWINEVSGSLLMMSSHFTYFDKNTLGYAFCFNF